MDESKHRGFHLIAAVILPDNAKLARQAVAALTLRGQTRIHMNKERDSRRRLILSTLAKLDMDVTIYTAGARHRTDLARREHCMRRLAADTALAGHTHLWIEQDPTLIDRDRQQIIEAVRSTGQPQFSYAHLSAAAEPLLAIPDAIAWAWPKGGDWRRRCEPMVTQVVEV
ncbi:MAG: hypothetical protein L0G99_05100 [Propionibacteriales bacterium]|nr:hypothetical protein [Propionibacteriales bacterium]